MSTHASVAHIPSGTGPAYWGPGDQIRFIVTGEQTGGTFFLAEVSVPPGGGPPPHVQHREEESFYMLEGTMDFHVAERAVQASPGDFVLIPRGAMHWFKNNSQGLVKMLCLCSPAGLEDFFTESFVPAGDDIANLPPPTPELIGRMMAAAAKCGVEIAGPPPH